MAAAMVSVAGQHHWYFDIPAEFPLLRIYKLYKVVLDVNKKIEGSRNNRISSLKPPVIENYFPKFTDICIYRLH